jgi:transposase-like protein
MKGAKFWLRDMSELKNRGVDDVLIAVDDGLKGFPDAITASFRRRWSRPALFICCATVSISTPTSATAH